MLYGCMPINVYLLYTQQIATIVKAAEVALQGGEPRMVSCAQWVGPAPAPDAPAPAPAPASITCTTSTATMPGAYGDESDEDDDDDEVRAHDVTRGKSLNPLGYYNVRLTSCNVRLC